MFDAKIWTSYKRFVIESISWLFLVHSDCLLASNKKFYIAMGTDPDGKAVSWDERLSNML